VKRTVLVVLLVVLFGGVAGRALATGVGIEAYDYLVDGECRIYDIGDERVAVYGGTTASKT